tara:strand:- start:176 stop:547 length:372 start_codon:yes stop_codon:yes gene_type:complete
MDQVRCMDTYALMEIIGGNPKFIDYLKIEFVITEEILAEFYYVLLRDHDEKTAEYWFNKLEGYSVSVNRFILKEAVKFRYDHRKQDVSFFDAVGYIYSVKHNMLFVTGDKEFEDLDNVEFVKK